MLAVVSRRLSIFTPSAITPRKLKRSITCYVQERTRKIFQLDK
jgi:hypothetical protein